MTEPYLAHQLANHLQETLPPGPSEALGHSMRLAGEMSLPIYLVGGAVRDLLLQRDGFDLDLSIEGDVEPLAQALAGATDGRLVLHERFGTAKVSGPRFTVDLARTRRETYPRPGALPVVEPATIIEDLARRDFTVNAIALRLTPEPAKLIDPFRGVDDAFNGLIRVLHEGSFRDDATRMLRALRYSTRLDFKIERQTEALIGRDLSYLENISGPRLRRELSLIFEERGPEASLLAQRLGILNAIHPALRLSKDVAGRWRDALNGKHYAPLDELGFCVTVAPGDEGTASSISKWLHLTGRIEHAMREVVRLQSLSPKLDQATGVEVVTMLDSAAPAAVWAVAVLHGGKLAEECLQYLDQWRDTKPALKGGDLIAIGVEPGPEVGDLLRRLRLERIAGQIRTREEEQARVRKIIEDRINQA